MWERRLRGLSGCSGHFPGKHGCKQSWVWPVRWLMGAGRVHTVCAAGLGGLHSASPAKRSRDGKIRSSEFPENSWAHTKRVKMICLRLRVNLHTSFNPAGLLCSATFMPPLRAETQPCRTIPGRPVPVLKGGNTASSRLSDPQPPASLPRFSGLPSLGE